MDTAVIGKVTFFQVIGKIGSLFFLCKIRGKINDLSHLLKRIGGIGVGGKNIWHGKGTKTLPLAASRTFFSRSLMLP